jgi:hypothetical protein
MKTSPVKPLNFSALGLAATSFGASQGGAHPGRPNVSVEAPHSVGGALTSRRTEAVTAGRLLVTVDNAEDLPRADRTSSDPCVSQRNAIDDHAMQHQRNA